MSLAPFGSSTAKEKVWLRPLPELGVTLVSAGGDGGAVAVHVPRVVHSAKAFVLSITAIVTFLAPANAALNVTGTVTVRLLPDPDTVNPLPVILQRLFSGFVADPGAMLIELD